MAWQRRLECPSGEQLTPAPKKNPATFLRFLGFFCRSWLPGQDWTFLSAASGFKSTGQRASNANGPREAGRFL
ncbi:hypothetical protein, partial [Mesorhizobium sp.]|uniref:hypothetical protein n=1 Tax=Mesorhizobium sp. TaxID=1871066 RepID=UPI0025ECBED0